MAYQNAAALISIQCSFVSSVLHFTPQTASNPGKMEPIAVKHIRKAAKLNAFLGYLPYGWSNKSGTITFRENPWQRIYFLLQLLMYWAYVLYLAIRAVYYSYYNPQGITASSRTELQYMAMGHMNAVPFQLCSLFFYGRHHTLLSTGTLPSKKQYDPTGATCGLDRN